MTETTKMTNVMSDEQYNEAVKYIDEYQNKTNINKIEEAVLMLLIESVGNYEYIKLNRGDKKE